MKFTLFDRIKVISVSMPYQLPLVGQNGIVGENQGCSAIFVKMEESGALAVFRDDEIVLDEN